ncbi:Transcriptional activator protein CopR [Azospirillaceae bacterium]
MNVLVIEDDQQAASYMVKGIKEGGHVVEHAADGVVGMTMAGRGCYDVLVVDRMLPLRDGLSLVEQLRSGGIDTPVLFLSALGSVDDKVKGLRAGGDDYLTKPYALAELLARIEVLGRRKGEGKPATRMVMADMEMDLLARTAKRAGKLIELLPREFMLLEYLMRNAGTVVTRAMLLENVWDYHFDPQTNVIDVHIARLRQKIDRDFTPPLIHTVRGVGYCLRTAAPDEKGEKDKKRASQLGSES